MSTHLPSWTTVAMPHADVRGEQAVKAEYAVNLGRIDRGEKALSKRYTDPRAFFEGTYVTTDLRRLLGDVMAALAGKNVNRVLQLRTPFGGGKSHSLLAMLHLARRAGRRSRPPPTSRAWLIQGPVRLAVLPCADLTPGVPRRTPTRGSSSAPSGASSRSGWAGPRGTRPCGASTKRRALRAGSWLMR